MIEENYNFTYIVRNVNIEQGTFEILFTPESEYLSPVALNAGLLPVSYLDIRDENNQLIYSSQDEVPFKEHLENTVKHTTPLYQWKKQYMLQNNIETLINATGNITVDNSTIVIPVLNPDPPLNT